MHVTGCLANRNSPGTQSSNTWQRDVCFNTASNQRRFAVNPNRREKCPRKARKRRLEGGEGWPRAFGPGVPSATETALEGWRVGG